MSAVDRFLKYVTFDTQSDDNSDTVPSTEKQKILGEYLVKELCSLGLTAEMTENGYVYASLAATPGLEDEAAVGFIAHMDTSPDADGGNVNPKVVEYSGGDIILSPGTVLSPDTFPSLKRHIGERLVVTDGKTLLGADDKAGIAEIMEAVFRVISEKIPHPPIKIGFTPDEEIGRGADLFDVSLFGARWGYTVDGGELGEVEYENFNAASADVTVHGLGVHPGYAKGKMKNAVVLASEFISLFPVSERPETTEGYEGYYHFNEVSGDVVKADLSIIIRDHDKEKFRFRKEFTENAVKKMNEKYGDGTFELTLRDSYYNMKEKIEPFMFIVDNAKKAMEENGVTPIVSPIRGGTDGARLSYMGLPCPNLSTGGDNAHGIYEYVSVDAMEKMTDVIISLMKK